ncbi:hypothetical protein LSUE1_G005808 [Lachnellula suecica]|uniref:Aminoglycoside phosphotransferase domain-containing protein n=1 Tax=Lachnellula suecica TaxID=602035 RepID=A0A8T9C3Y1_9HELO|nr:hypothetical protein LSUE1_G005808 [Lachnellula suecica]
MPRMVPTGRASPDIIKDGPSPFSAPTLLSSKPNSSRSHRNNILCNVLTQTLINLYQRDKSIVEGVLRIPHLVPSVPLLEAISLQYVAQNSSVPVPKVHCAFRHKYVTYIVMGLVKGEEIGKNWTERPEAEKESLLEGPDSGPSPTKRIATSFFGLQLDYAIVDPEKSWIAPEEVAEMRKLVEMQDEKTHCVYFTHGDVSSSNIIVNNGKVVALIDFETAGFSPEYWE